MKNKFKFNSTIVLTILVIVQIACAVSAITPTPISNIPTIQPTITIELTIEPTITNSISNSKNNSFVIVKNNCEFLNIRKFENENSQIFATIPAGTRIELITKTNLIEIDKWYEIQYNGIVGFVKGFYIEFDKSTP